MKRILGVAILTLGVAVAWAPGLRGQSAGTHPISGRQYAFPMSVEGAPWLERRERVDEEEPDLALRLLRVAKGSTVADIGAGSGYMTVRLAKIVGPMGRVYANDIQPGMLELLQKNVDEDKLTNVTPVLGHASTIPSSRPTRSTWRSWWTSITSCRSRSGCCSG